MGWAGREGRSELCRGVRSESRGACAALQQLLLHWHFSHTRNLGVKPGLAQLLVNLGGFPHTTQGAMCLQKGMQTSVVTVLGVTSDFCDLQCTERVWGPPASHPGATACRCRPSGELVLCYQ